ncbi:MAG: calcium-translocating P-type ATPase, PMCA-type [Prevotellaceae bacterium]|jgi:Ca2+-transporting ATPase|nr:calcium-translocating P-type ATPase, PMCA-type [Prevotellaceae bacterium]
MKYRGLDSGEVLLSREKNGNNELTPVPRTPWWTMLLEKFNDPLIKLLLFAALLSLVVGYFEQSYLEALGIIAAVLLAVLVAFFNEYSAGKEFDLLNKVNDEAAVKVFRNGQATTAPKRDIVKGDIVILEQGDEVPADGRVLECFSLYINESTLNGESVPAAKQAELAERYITTYSPNVLLRGTTVTDGQGVMEVTAVGDVTELGKTSREAAVESGEDTPLNKQLNRLGTVIGKVGIAMASAVFLLLALRDVLSGTPLFPLSLQTLSIFLTYFMVAVALIVMAVPEGLAMSVTLSLAYSMRRMTRTNNLVRRMHATETMGAATVICTDKTGTLTQNKMHVHAAHFDQLTAAQYDLIAESMALNSTAHLDLTNVTEAQPVGNPTEASLLLWLHERQIDYADLRAKAPVTGRLSFTTENKFMTTRCVSPSLQKEMLYVKGGAEVVMNRCVSVPAGVQELLQDYQSRGMRTLAFAYREVQPGEHNDLPEGSTQLTYLGFVAISDPVRKEVGEAIKSCMDAGIEVKIVTGDISATATEIARQTGLWNDTDDASKQIAGAEFAALNDADAATVAGRIKIMSRARPSDKLRLVKLLQQRHEVVAVTGDGTNDAPALNYANVGLSMGSGTSVAKEASDIVLLDDSFNSIVNAIQWGRSLYGNIQRFLQFQLTINVAALVIAFLGPFVGVTLPFTVTQMLWVNLIMDTFAALALATEPPSRSVMSKKPRRVTDFIITPLMAKNIFGWAAVFFVILLGLFFWFGHTAEGLTPYRLSLFFTVFVMLQFWNLFNARCLGTSNSAFYRLHKNAMFVVIALLILALQVAIVQFGGEVFRTVPLTFRDWIIVIGATSAVLWTGEIERGIKRLKTYRYADL